MADVNDAKIGTNPEVMKAVLEQDKKLRMEIQEKYGFARTVLLSEMANLSLYNTIGMVPPPVAYSMENLIKHAIDIMGIPPAEAFEWIKRLADGRITQEAQQPVTHVPGPETRQ